MFEIVLTREAQKDYQKLAKNMARRINQRMDNLRENPLQYPQAIPLKGKLAGFYRWRLGDWCKKRKPDEYSLYQGNRPYRAYTKKPPTCW